MTLVPGLNFFLGEDINMLRDSVAAFVAAEITPRAEQADRTDAPQPHHPEPVQAGDEEQPGPDQGDQDGLAEVGLQHQRHGLRPGDCSAYYR